MWRNRRIVYIEKNNKGFTLIELLAVIVILAVIALIAVPLILSLVNKSRLKAAEESALFYVDTIENMLMINNIENTDGKTYKVKGKTVVDENNEVILNLEIKGDTPYNGVNNEIKINNGFVEMANLRFNAYYVHYEMDMETKEFKTCTSQKGFLDKCDGTGEVKPSTPDEPKVESGATIEIAKDKTYLAEVYLDPTDISKKCTKEEALANVNEFGTPTLIKEGCMKWYVYKDDGKNYTMILDHNTTVHVQWNSTLTNDSKEDHKMKEVGEQLEKDIGNWDTSIKNTARLISADEIAELTGANKEDNLKWNSNKILGLGNSLAENDKEQFIGWYYLDGSGSTYGEWRKKTYILSRYDWLFNYTYSCLGASGGYFCSVADSNSYRSDYDGKKYFSGGYWTSTLFAPSQVQDSLEFKVSIIDDYGRLHNSSPLIAQSYGIRPVITIPK